MLSNHSANAAPSANPLTGGVPPRANPFDSNQQQPPTVNGAPVPGVKDGGVPTNPQSVNPLSQSTEDPNNPTTNPLEQYAIKTDNDGNQLDDAGNVVKPTTPVKPVAPTADDFSKLAQQVAAGITPPDQELVTRALSGAEDSGQALMDLLAAQQQEIMGKTMHATFLANSNLANQNAEAQTTQIRTDLENQNYDQTATQAAVAESPELKEGIKATLLATAIAELRKKYPKAPAQLLGQEAAKQLITKPEGNDHQDGVPATNWTEELLR